MGFDMVVHAYDDSKREVVRVFKTVFKFEPIKTNVEFKFPYIPLVFSLLLGQVSSYNQESVP